MITRERIEELQNDPEFIAAANNCKSIEDATALLKEYGIEINSWDDFMAELKSVMMDSDGELNDDELGTVQGGGWGVCLFGGFGVSDTCFVGGVCTLCFVYGFTC